MKIELVHPEDWDDKFHHWWPSLTHLQQIGCDNFGQILTLGLPSVMSGSTFHDFLAPRTLLTILWIDHLGPPNRQTLEDSTSRLHAWDMLFKKSRISLEDRAVTMRVCCKPSPAVSCGVLLIWQVLLVFSVTVDVHSAMRLESWFHSDDWRLTVVTKIKKLSPNETWNSYWKHNEF